MTAPSGLDWQRVEEIFHRISQEPPEQWLRLAEEAGEGDAALLAEVLSLLEASRGSGQLDVKIRETMEDWLADERQGPELEPKSIGPFEIVRRIGEGGLAVVYLAERREPYHQFVAIKLLKRGLETDEILRRLTLEGQILAELEHPNVARLLDGGWTAEGRPYFVLEYIEGEPIDQYCDARRLDVRERLRLFRSVCVAVQQAHNRLIVHRDLKPPNLLVTADGVPKLLDFGIAKLLDASRLGVTIAKTRPGAQWMTPDYAAPEQIRGETLTTAVDIYALGILLYQLLCGRLPRQLDGKSPVEMERLLEVGAEPPSHRVDASAADLRATSPERLARALRGDLDTIVAKALRAQPARRYASAQQLADDLDRFLASKPVLARPDTWTYRSVKFVRRHRAAVAGVAASFVSLVAAVVVTGHSLHVAEAQRRLAEQRLGETEAVIEFTTHMFEIADPGEARGNRVTVREILDRGAQRVPREMTDQPAIAARLMDTMGQVYRNLGLYESARSLLADAAERWRAAAVEDSPESLSTRRNLVAVLMDQGHFDQAARELEGVRRAEEELLGPEHPDVASTLFLSARVARQLEDDRAAEPLLRRSLALRLGSFGELHASVAESRNDLGQVLFDLGDLAGAEEQHRRALSTRRRALGEDHPAYAESLHNLATTLEARGAFVEAESEYLEVLRLRRSILGDVHRDVAATLNNLAAVQCRLGHHEKALETLRQALAISRETVPRHPNTYGILSNLALELKETGRLDEAVLAMSEVLAWNESLYGDSSEHVMQSQFNFALILTAAGRREEAKLLLRKNLDAMSALGMEAPRAYPLTLLAQLEAESDRCDRSVPLAQEALELRADLPAGSSLRQRTEEVLGLCETQKDPR